MPNEEECFKVSYHEMRHEFAGINEQMWGRKNWQLLTHTSHVDYHLKKIHMGAPKIVVPSHEYIISANYKLLKQ
jgi:hypothetical protein